MMHANTILVVDDEPDIRDIIRDVLSDEGYPVSTAANAQDARSKFAAERPALVLLDIWMPDTDGIALLKEWREKDGSKVPVIMISGHGTVETAVEAIRIGAYDFLEKPLSTAKLLVTVERALETVALKAENVTLKTQLEPVSGFVGHSDAINELNELINRMAGMRQPLLIRGEPGSGKGVAARVLHRASSYANGPFIEAPLGTLEAAAMGDALFGIGREGVNAPGYLEQAIGGTLVLDEISALDDETQARLIRMLETGSFTRGSDHTPVPADFRIVATSNQHLEERLTAKQLREDFFYRLSSITIKIPPLRAHREDIPDLITFYTQQIIDSQHLPFRRFSTSSINYLRNRPWPGNVRELVNFIHRVLLTTSSEVIEADETREIMGLSASPVEAVEEKNAWKDFGQPLRSARERFERDYLEFHLRQAKGNMSELARRTELERTHLYRKLKGLGLDPKDSKYRA